MAQVHQKLQLAFNPFEPAGSGPPIAAGLSVPEGLQEEVQTILQSHDSALGVRTLVVVGEYGSGKTCLLQWLADEVLPQRRIKPFYFDNPGVHFYRLANRLLSTIGRKDFAKFVWELVGARMAGYQGSLFGQTYEDYLFSQRRPRPQEVTRPVQDAVLSAGVTTDEQIANCLARIVTEAVKKPYFEYRDFVPRQHGSVVAESEEAPYFRAILKVIGHGLNARAVAFLVDEFEEIGLQKRLTRREAQEYLGTLKRLLNLTQRQGEDDVDFWVILSMTPSVYETTQRLDPALYGRFSNRIQISPLSLGDAEALIRTRLESARTPPETAAQGSLFPFRPGIGFTRGTYMNPRELVKACFYAIAETRDSTEVPFSPQYLQEVEKRVSRAMKRGERTQ